MNPPTTQPRQNAHVVSSLRRECTIDTAWQLEIHATSLAAVAEGLRVGSNRENELVWAAARDGLWQHKNQHLASVERRARLHTTSIAHAHPALLHSAVPRGCSKCKARRITLYASSNDEAIKLSKKVHAYPRAGESGPDIVVVPGLDTIDVSNVDTSLLGHSYFAEKRTVISDLFYLIRDGKARTNGIA